MIVALSIDREFKDYKEFEKVLRKIEKMEEFSEFVAVNNDLLKSYVGQHTPPVQYFQIEWNNIEGKPNIKNNKFGKPYNADAPAETASKIAKYATHIVCFGRGDYCLNKAAQDRGLSKLDGVAPKSDKDSPKKYKL